MHESPSPGLGGETKSCEVCSRVRNELRSHCQRALWCNTFPQAHRSVLRLSVTVLPLPSAFRFPRISFEYCERLKESAIDNPKIYNGGRKFSKHHLFFWYFVQKHKTNYFKTSLIQIPGRGRHRLRKNHLKKQNLKIHKAPALSDCQTVVSTNDVAA